MHKTEILNSQITFMKRLKYFKCSLSITTSYSQIFVFFLPKEVPSPPPSPPPPQLKLLAASVVPNHSAEVEHTE